MVIKDIKRGFYYGGRNYDGAVTWVADCEGAKHYKSTQGILKGFWSLVHSGVRLETELAIES